MRLVFSAASHAQRAVDFLHDLVDTKQLPINELLRYQTATR